MIRLSKDQVILLHERLIEATGGGDGIRDDGMLDSALANPFQSFGDEELYPSIQAKATQKELSDTILDLASGKIGAEDILQWIISHQK